MATMSYALSIFSGSSLSLQASKSAESRVSGRTVRDASPRIELTPTQLDSTAARLLGLKSIKRDYSDTLESIDSVSE